MWEGTNKDGKKWMASINEERCILSLLFLDGGEIYEYSLDEFLSENKVHFASTEVQNEILDKARQVKEVFIQKRRIPLDGWISIKNCTICSKWPEQLHNDMSTTLSATSNEFPKEVENLILIFGHRRYDSPEIRRCPQCGTYYKIENVYEWTTLGNDDDDYLTRLTPFEAFELIPNAEKAELRSRWNNLMQDFEIISKSNTPHLKEYAMKALKDEHKITW